MTQSLYSVADLRAAEKTHASLHPRISLMQRAGRAAAKWSLAQLKQQKSRSRHILVLAGPGNNGGDAWVTAEALREAKCHVTVLALGEQKLADPAARHAHQSFQKGMGRIVRRWADVELAAGEASLVIDGLFGIGLKRAPTGAFADTIRAVNELHAATDVPVLALDVPSGLDAETGHAFDPTIRATHTLTFLGLKPGLYTGDGLDCVGQVILDNLDITLPDSPDTLLDAASVQSLIPQRKKNSHKGSFGNVAIIGGTNGMVGAAVLAARAALHMGPGKVYLGLLSTERLSFDPLHPEILVQDAKLLAKDDEIDAIAVGMGMSDAGIGTTVLHGIFSGSKPAVIDADALTSLAANTSIGAAFEANMAGEARQRLSFIFTPHPGEAARLLKCSSEEVQKDRVSAARKLAAQFNSVVILKGAGTVIATPVGRYFINTSGNPGMASGGMGDALSGMLAAFLAQGLDTLNAAKLAVYLHGAAADAAMEHGMAPRGLTASEVIFEARMLLNSELEHAEH
jgi:hydroxyethylthiazole kinase-like uncharacterized protein yjeF